MSNNLTSGNQSPQLNERRNSTESFTPTSGLQPPLNVESGMKDPPQQNVITDDILQRLASLESTNSAQEAQIRAMSARIKTLEEQQYRTIGIMAIKDRVSELLGKRINQLEQYTRRYSVVVKGIEKPQNETMDQLKEKISGLIQVSGSGVTFNDVDKCHRNGQIKDNEQEVIVRFKSHTAKESFYEKRKEIPNKSIKIQPSLTAESKSLLEQAREQIADLQHNGMKNVPEFVYADVHGTLKVKMSLPTKVSKNSSWTTMFHRFDSIPSLYEVVYRCNQGNHKFEDDRGDPSTDLPAFVEIVS